MSQKMLQQALKIDLGKQPNFRRLFGAVLELIWTSFGGQIGTFGGPGRFKMGRLELRPCSPATFSHPADAKDAVCTPRTGSRVLWRRPNGHKMTPKELQIRAWAQKIGPRALKIDPQGAQTDPQTFKMDTLSSKSRPPRLPQSTPWSRFSVLCSQSSVLDGLVGTREAYRIIVPQANAQ